MSILSNLNTGATGLSANADALGVVADNIANTNTIAFKRARANFQDLVASAGSSDLNTIGSGARVGSVQTMWKQGTLLSTEASMDLALQGEGYFMVNGTAQSGQGDFYTRAGQFHLDKDGYVVNPENLRMQGYMADPSGAILGQLTDVQIGLTTLPATATTTADIGVNLDANAPVTPAFNAMTPGATSSYSTGVTVYDSLGNAHEITTYYTHTGPAPGIPGPNTWTWNSVVDGADVLAAGGIPGEPFSPPGASGALTFDTSGVLDPLTAVPVATNWAFDGAAAQTITFDFSAGTTGYASPSAAGSISQDGSAAGSVASLDISTDGTISGKFTNGQTRALAQAAVASFKSVDGLSRVGNGLWEETTESGQPLVGTATTGGRGAVVAGSLEQSNVDIGREFVDLIAYQRGFSASSKIIQTSDEMYGELVNLKR